MSLRRRLPLERQVRRGPRRKRLGRYPRRPSKILHLPGVTPIVAPPVGFARPTKNFSRRLPPRSGRYAFWRTGLSLSGRSSQSLADSFQDTVHEPSRLLT
jgi:hypothetical protein